MTEKCPKCGLIVPLLEGDQPWIHRHVEGDLVCLTRQVFQKDAIIATQAKRIAELETALDLYPKTVDGVPITLGCRVYYHSLAPDTLTKGNRVARIEMCLYDNEPEWIVATDEVVYEGKWLALPDDFGLYSTPEAARIGGLLPDTTEAKGEQSRGKE